MWTFGYCWIKTYATKNAGYLWNPEPPMITCCQSMVGYCRMWLSSANWIFCFHNWESRIKCWLGISRAGILSIIYTVGITLSTESQQGELHIRLDWKLKHLVLILTHKWIHSVSQTHKMSTSMSTEELLRRFRNEVVDSIPVQCTNRDVDYNGK